MFIISILLADGAFPPASFGIPKEIFLLAGQSNMAGRGGVVGQEWDKYARDPLHKDIDNGRPCGVGPGMPFSNMLLKKDPRVGVIGLVPCAVGGTSISQWQRGGFLYDRLLMRANAALQDGGTIRAMLWYQGESDSNDTTSAEMYGTRLEQFFCDLWLDLASPLLPIVQVAVTSTAGRYVDIVRKAQLEMDLPNIFCIDANGLEVNRNDELHLTTSAQVQLGRMFADVILYCTIVGANNKLLPNEIKLHVCPNVLPQGKNEALPANENATQLLQEKNALISSTHKALGIDMARNSGISTLDNASATLFS
ncbi:hypothetical protein OROGR_019080 [Orobanche gracilis]